MRTADVADSEVRLNKGLLMSGAVLVGIGGFLGASGLLLGTTAIASAMRKWVRQIDHSPAGAAKQKWQQARSATLAGAKAWQGDLD